MKAFDRWFLYDDDHVIAHYASAEMAYEHRVKAWKRKAKR